MDESSVGIVIFGILFGGMFFYFLPTAIAVLQWKRNLVAIAALNLLLGWTFIGWVAALIWAMTQD